MLQLKTGSMEAVLKQNKKIVCFGAGTLGEFMLQSYPELRRAENLLFMDNDGKKSGTYLSVGNDKFPILSVADFKQNNRDEFVLIIVPVYFYNMVKQLDEDVYFDGVEAFLYPCISSDKEYMRPYQIHNTTSPCIPKVIHYCWFGGRDIPDTLQRIMSSWKEKCPDYEIVRWDESNYDIKKNRYMYEAYQKGYYAYVSDYVRKDILYQYGGIYLDTDVEILRNIDDLRYNNAFVGLDDVGNLGSGAGMGAVAGFPLIRQLREDYENISFIRQDGTLNLQPSGINETRVLLGKGMQQKGRFQQVEGMSIFPREVLLPESWCGLPDCYTENTYMVHRFQKYVYGYKNENVQELRNNVKKMLDRCRQ